MSSPAGVDLPDDVPIPVPALGPALNDRGYYCGRVERNLFWVTDGTYQAAFLATEEGIVLFDAPPTIGHNLRRAIDEVAEGEGVANKVTHLVYSHHHADHAGAADLFGNDLTRIGHVQTRRLLLRDNDPLGRLQKKRSKTPTPSGSEMTASNWHSAGRITHPTTSSSTFPNTTH